MPDALLPAAPPPAADDPDGLTEPFAPAVEPGRPVLTWRQVAFPLVLSLVAIAVAIWATYEPGAFALMRSALRPGYLALAVGALALQQCVAAWRIHYVARGELSFGKALRGQFTWDFLSGVTPSAIGGGPLAAVFIARENQIPLGRSTAMILYLMVADLVWFATLVLTLLLASTQVQLFPDSIGAIGAGTMTLFFVALLVWASFFTYATLVRPTVLERLLRWIVRLRPFRRFEGRVGDELVRLRRQSEVLRGRSVGFFVGAVAISAGMWVCRYLVLLFVAWSVTPGLDVGLFMLRAASLWLTILVMPTPGGAGGMEAMYVLFLGSLLPDGFIGPALLTWRLMAYYVVVGIGFGIASSTLGEMLLARRAARASRAAR